jgi:hypothetical protein
MVATAEIVLLAIQYVWHKAGLAAPVLAVAHKEIVE